MSYKIKLSMMHIVMICGRNVNYYVCHINVSCIFRAGGIYSYLWETASQDACVQIVTK